MRAREAGYDERKSSRGTTEWPTGNRWTELIGDLKPPRNTREDRLRKETAERPSPSTLREKIRVAPC